MPMRLLRVRARKGQSETFVLSEEQAKYVMISETSSKQARMYFEKNRPKLS